GRNLPTSSHTSFTTMLKNWTNHTWAFLSLRLWIGLRWLLVGLEKFELNGAYSLANHSENMERMATGIANSTPLLPEWLTRIYTWPLGYIHVALGIVLLLGIKTRIALIFSSLMFISLSVGLMAVSEEEGIAWLAIHMLLNVWALTLLQHNRLALIQDRPTPSAQ
ncbi:MAG: hypothetical protein PHF70_00905, partial [Opitutales bacterium]|nr:hypothetical protein [Opitutales bacterium]